MPRDQILRASAWKCDRFEPHARFLICAMCDVVSSVIFSMRAAFVLCRHEALRAEIANVSSLAAPHRPAFKKSSELILNISQIR